MIDNISIIDDKLIVYCGNSTTIMHNEYILTIEGTIQFNLKHEIKIPNPIMFTLFIILNA